MTETATQTPGTRPFQGWTIPAPGTFDLDQAHTRIGFSARHMMVSKVRGRFGEFSGSITIAAEIDREDFGMTWNVALETGGVLVGKTVKLEIEGEAVRRG